MKGLLKIFLFSFLFILSTLESDGQPRRKLAADFHIGVNLASMDIEGANADKVPKLGVHLGANVNYKFYKNLQFQTGFWVSKKGYKQDITTREEDLNLNKIYVTEDKRNVAAAYIQVPVCLGYEVYLSKQFAFNLNGGVYAAYGFKGKRWTEGSRTVYDWDMASGIITYEDTEIHAKTENETFDVAQLKRMDYGLIGKVGVIYDICVFTVGYEYGLNNVANDRVSVIKNRTISLALGVRF